ncbi:MAG: [CysO sulfur-carrier protein]-S-L-cysteine hydrolase [Thermoleophilaceae bacterium]|jgi:proteasome lid subunit RPN8/RPN11|nr:[CysO sulfur-carrier protein]-S-L-cysteine hydrolase [Thermoleophilaceae bacterium]
MEISQAQLDEVIAHAQADAPNECCGYMSLDDGSVAEVFRAENIKNSPYGYELGFKDLRAANELEDAGLQVAIYHSHPRSPAEPSQTDINLAHYPHWLYVIVSLAGEPEMRAWRIGDGRVQEEPVTVA